MNGSDNINIISPMIFITNYHYHGISIYQPLSWDGHFTPNGAPNVAPRDAALAAVLHSGPGRW